MREVGVPSPPCTNKIAPSETKRKPKRSRLAPVCAGLRGSCFDAGGEVCGEVKHAGRGFDNRAKQTFAHAWMIPSCNPVCIWYRPERSAERVGEHMC